MAGRWFRGPDAIIDWNFSKTWLALGSAGTLACSTEVASAGGFSLSKLHTPPSGLAFMSTATPPWKCLVSEDKQGRTWLVLGWEDCVHNSCHLFSRALCSCAFTKSSLFLYCHLNGIKTSVFSSIFSWKLGFTHKIIDLANGFSNRI